MAAESTPRVHARPSGDVHVTARTRRHAPGMQLRASPPTASHPPSGSTIAAIVKNGPPPCSETSSGAEVQVIPSAERQMATTPSAFRDPMPSTPWGPATTWPSRPSSIRCCGCHVRPSVEATTVPKTRSTARNCVPVHTTLVNGASSAGWIVIRSQLAPNEAA